MVVMMKSVGINKMRVCRPKSCRPLIHHAHKAFYTPADLLCDYIGGIIGRYRHKRVQKLAERQNVAFFQLGGSRSAVVQRDCRLAHRRLRL